MQAIAWAMFLSGAILSLFGRRGMLAGMVFVGLLPWPILILVTGDRSAIYGLEALIYMVAVLWWFGRYGNDPRVEPKPFRNRLLALALYCMIGTAITSISGLQERVWSWAAISTFRLFAAGLCFLVPASLFLTRSETVFTLRVMLAGICILCVLAAAQSVGVVSLPDLQELYGGEEIERTSGEVSSFLAFARHDAGTLGLLGIAATMALVALRALPMPLALGSGGLSVFLILSSFSRSSLAAAAAMAMATPLFSRTNRLRNLLLTIAGLSVGAVLLANVPAFAERFRTMANPAAVSEALEGGGRMRLWQLSYEYLMARPWMMFTGVGYEGWGQHVLQYVRFSTAHDAYLHSLVELGFLGTGLILAFYLGLMRFAWRASKPAWDNPAPMGGIMLLLLIGMAVSSLGEVTLYPTVNSLRILKLTLVFMGIGVGYTRGQRRHALSAEVASDQSWPEPISASAGLAWS